MPGSLIRALRGGAHSRALLMLAGLSPPSQFPSCTSEMFFVVSRTESRLGPALLSSWGCGKTALAAELIPLLAPSFQRPQFQHIINTEILKTCCSIFFFFCFSCRIKVTDCCCTPQGNWQRSKGIMILSLCVFLRSQSSGAAPELLKTLLPGQLPPSGTWLHFRNQSV